MNKKIFVINLISGLVSIAPAFFLVAFCSDFWVKDKSYWLTQTVLIFVLLSLLLIPNLIIYTKNNLSMGRKNILIALCGFFIPYVILFLLFFFYNLAESNSPIALEAVMKLNNTRGSCGYA